MTLKIDFNQDNHQQLVKHIKWLVEIGLVQSYHLDPINRVIPEPTTEKFINNMITQGQEDFDKGETYTQEVVKQKIQEWQNSKK